MISIIALLISLLLPALGQARETARAVQCKSNFRQAAIGVSTYAVEHRDLLPPIEFEWSGTGEANSFGLRILNDYMFPHQNPPTRLGWASAKAWPYRSKLHCPSTANDIRPGESSDVWYSYAFVEADNNKGPFNHCWNGENVNGVVVKTWADWANAGLWKRSSDFANSACAMFVDHNTWRSPRGFLNNGPGQHAGVRHLGNMHVVFMDGHTEQRDHAWTLTVSSPEWKMFSTGTP